MLFNLANQSKTQRELRVVVIGAGMSGILAAIRLREEGIADVTVYEKGDRVGGTWRENTYPGLSCDVPSHVYCYSFEPNPNWSRVFSPGPEILEYFEGVAAKYDVLDIVRLGEEVTSSHFVDGRWRLETSKGRTDVADVVITATGVLHQPHVPELPGLDSFEGEHFHTARWNHDFDLTGKRVGIIGTGSTAIQIVGATVDQVEILSLFQRTAQWVLPQVNTPYTDEEKQNFRDNPEVMTHIYETMSQTFEDNFAAAVIDANSEQMKMIEAACLENLESNVHDPELRKRLTPDYRAGCKRLVISGEFYEAIQKPTARLVDAGIERIEAKGIRTTDGELHELDAIVLATGFEAHQFMRPMDIVGRDGIKLDDVWRRNTPAYRTVSIPGFPNFFMLIGPTSPIGNFSLVEVAEMQFNYIMQLIEKVRGGEVRELEAEQAATDIFNAEAVEATKGTIWVTGCRSWYLNDDGIPAAWPWTLGRFRKEMAKPEMKDFRVRV
ncbi:MAG: cation diffusion facilitator CzcD-associated flavoprotein CzcO [Myxococcota bacterium]